jgi:prepilin-type N-terminal cleavage/methylation domain-containing protein
MMRPPARVGLPQIARQALPADSLTPPTPLSHKRARGGQERSFSPSPLCGRGGRGVRGGFTLMELLVVNAIIAVLIGLLLPAVQKVREAAARIQCANNLKQIALAMHNYHDAHGCMPPGLGYAYAGSTAYGSGYLHALPYLEEQNLYDKAQVGGIVWAGNNEVRGTVLKKLLCPSDPTTGDEVRDNNGVLWGPSSYAGNAQVFCETWPGGYFKGINAWPRLETSFPDGTSTTILFAEKYAHCDNVAFTYGGSRWAYDVVGVGTLPLHPAFAVSWTDYSIGPSSYFQVRPQKGFCDTSLASTPHQVMNVAMADGSVTSKSPQMTKGLWWKHLTPAGGEVISE